MSEQVTFGTRLKDFRKARKLNGEELGNIIGIKKGQVSSIENDKSMLTLEGFINIINAFVDLNPRWLATGQGEMIISTKQTQDAETCWKLLQVEKGNTEVQRNRAETYLSILIDNGIKVE